MAEGVLFSVAQEVLKYLGTKALDEIALAWGFKDRLEQLKSTMHTLKDVLLDAEEKQTDSHTVRGWLERLTTVVYCADDLFDEVATVASQKQLKGGNPFTKEVRIFFSCSNQVVFAFKISQKIKTIRQQLDDIKRDGDQFNFLVHHSLEEGRNETSKREQTYSYVDAERIIGRDDDKNAILDMLLASSSSDDDKEVLPVLPIVGIGGMGKTALAQLIYNDPRVQEFFELRLWVCVSDVFDIKGITGKILMAATNKETQKLEMQQLLGQMRKEIGDKKYLLVLDDVWNEDREKWLELRALLKIGRKGSKILVTTRSRVVAKIMGTFPPYDLQGILEEKAWDLFEQLAFNPGEAKQKPHLVEVGKEILNKCANVPLAIRTVASLLYGKEEKKWLSFKDRSLAKISEDGQSHVMDILKLSYHHLWSPLKNCFAYCALFPKDYEFDKESLIDLWMAEGFIISDANGSQSLEELGDEYFFTLLQRCFFQDVKKDEFGITIRSCKMHDLIHDLAQEVSGVKCKVVESDESRYDDKTYHLSFVYSLNSQWKLPDGMKNLKLLRTLILPQQREDGSTFSQSMCQELISSYSYLRVLDLRKLGVKSLPSSLGKLVHLRYLNLSYNPIRDLPDSITELLNLQTLDLYFCHNLERLPTKIRKLLNLRSLDVGACNKLRHMPLGLGELTLLRKLPLFIINSDKSPELRKKPMNTANLSSLKKLDNLRGKLTIKFLEESKNPMSEATEANLSCKDGLTVLTMDFRPNLGGEVSEHDEVVLERLKPHHNLRKLIIYRYLGKKLPSWLDSICITLPNLVEIVVEGQRVCQEVLPTFSKLRSLKRLTLTYLSKVKYMEMEYVNDVSTSIKPPSIQTPLFFPSLECLELRNMASLKGWWSCSEELGQLRAPLSFPKLSELEIYGCPRLVSLPNCPCVKRLSISNRNNKDVSVLKMLTSLSQLMELTINAEDLKSLPKYSICQLSKLVVEDYWALECTDKLEHVFASLSSSLRSLEFLFCARLKSISRGLEHLTALKELCIQNCRQLDLSPEGEDHDMPWKAFKNSLRSLKLICLDELVSLPSGLRHLTNLRYLYLSRNKNLKELPEWISCFSSLQSFDLWYNPKVTSLPEGFFKLTALNELSIRGQPELQQRFKRLDGCDWPKIQHIPLLYVEDD